MSNRFNHHTFVETEGSRCQAGCSCGWKGSPLPASKPEYADAEARFHLKSALNSEYGEEKHASPATAYWHLTLKSTNGRTYTPIVDGLAEAIDYAHTMRFEFGWELIDFHRED